MIRKKTAKPRAFSVAVVISLIMVVALPVLAMVVSDPTSYQYYVEQLKKASDQIKKLEQQVQELNSIKTSTSKLSSDVRGNYNRATGLMDDIRKLRKKLDEQPTTLQGDALKWLSLAGDGLEIGEDGFVSADKILNEKFIDPRDYERHKEALAALDYRYQTRQASLKNTIVKSDELLRQMPDRLKAIEALVDQIDRTENVKDAQDLTNRFLAEILKVLSEQLALASQMAESFSLLNFSGVDDKTMQERLNQLSHEQQKLSALEKELLAAGVDPKNLTTSDIKSKLLKIE